MQKLSTIVLYVLALISLVLAGLFFFGPKTTISGVENVPEYFDVNIFWSAILLGLAIVITFFFTIEYLITHPQSLKGAAIAIVAGGILLLVSYLLASDAQPAILKDDFSPKLLKWVDVGLIATYILGAVAIIGMIVSEIYRAFQ